MRRPGVLALVAAAVAGALISPAAGVGAGTAAALPLAAEARALPFAQALRRCDFSEYVYSGPAFYGRPAGNLRSEGGTLVADLTFATGTPNARYDVKLIQVPRSSAQSCNAGDPGVAYATMFTDTNGAGAVTVRGPIAPGSTGVWASVTRQGPFAQLPEEFYTTDIVYGI